MKTFLSGEKKMDKNDVLVFVKDEKSVKEFNLIINERMKYFYNLGYEMASNYYSAEIDRLKHENRILKGDKC